LPHGIDVALIGYTLAPEATLTEIVGEIHQALSYLSAHAGRRVAGYARSNSSAGHAGVATDAEPTFHLDHSMRAGQRKEGFLQRT
jgi:hypothetical protein